MYSKCMSSTVKRDVPVIHCICKATSTNKVLNSSLTESIIGTGTPQTQDLADAHN